MRRLSLLAVLLTLGLFSGTRQAAALPAGSSIPWQGNNLFLLGANLPWYNYGSDFGGGANKGVSSPTVQAALTPVLAQAQAAGMDTIRWWMFEGDPSKGNGGAAPQISTDADGAPTGISPAVYADIDAALQLANTYGLGYDFVLFSAPTAIPRGWITDPTQQAALASVLGQLFAHYAGNPHILSWEVFNEPEWDIQNGKIALAPVQATVRAIADAVHANSSAYVTVGSAQLHDVSDWTGLGLDYYEAHWYDAFSAPDDPTAVTYAQAQSQYHVDAPLVIGEFNTTTSDQTAFSRFSTLQANGYAGAWPWSLLPDHTSDHLAIDFPGAQAFAAQALGLAAAPLTSPPGQLPALPSTTAVQGPEVQGPAVQGPPFAAAPFPSFLPSPALAQPSSAPPSRAASPSPVDTTATANPFAGTQPLATAQCQDGWFSFSQTAALTCAGHGGVMVWVTQPGTAAAVVASRADEQAATNPNPGCQVFVGDGEFTGECSGPSLQSGGGSGPTGGGGGGATSGGGGGATGCGSRGGPGYRLPSGKCA